MQNDDIIRQLALPGPVYRVGGSVRDEIMGLAPKDTDYVVFETPLDELKRSIQALGWKGKPLKLRDGQHVGYRFRDIEIVLPRREISTGPGHGDFEIVVDPSLSVAEDATRRDFTFNALYMDVRSEEIVDPLGGVNDLLGRRIKVTHPDSFRDDPLRILRALRFVARWFDLTDETRALMAVHANAVTGLTVKGVSGTVFEELCKILMGDRPHDALRVARDTGVLAHVLPEIAPMLGHDAGSRYHDLDTDEHTFKALEVAAKIDAPLVVRLALLFHDSGKPYAEWVGDDGRKHYYARVTSTMTTRNHEEVSEEIWLGAAKRLNVGRMLTNDVATLIREHMLTGKPKWTKVARNRVRLGDEALMHLHMHRMCDIAGKVSTRLQKATVEVAEMEELRREMQHKGVPTHHSELAIGGLDVIEAGFTGPDIGRVLSNVLDEVVVGWSPQKETRAWQLTRLAACS